MNADLEGIVLRIERSSIHDGQGLRTVVFLKGCPLRCRWCSTPESQKAAPERGYVGDRCRGCGACVKRCPAGALALVQDKIEWDNRLCRDCLTCVSICPNEAVIGYGRKMTVAQVMEQICRDEIFFFHSGGGVTLSGGECLQQPDFVEAILQNCQLNGIDTAIETSLFAPWKSVERILPLLNSMYVDLKHPDGVEHKKLTGVDIAPILANLERVCKTPSPLSIILRIPLIPGINDSDEVLRQVVNLASSLKSLQEIEILPYHRLGAGSYARLGRSYCLHDLAAPSDKYLLQRYAFIQTLDSSVPVRITGG